MSVEGSIQAALMAQAATITEYTLAYQRKGGQQPSADHIRVAHVPNDNANADLSSQVQERMGFLYLTLVLDTGEYDVVAREAAGDIVEAYFPRGSVLTHDGVSVKITGHTIRPGREEGGRWETPIRVAYWSMA